MTRDGRPSQTETELSTYAPFAEAPSRAQPRLEWLDADGVRARPLDGPTIVGSAPAAGVVLRDPTVSRLHAELDVRDDGVWVRDLGSRNGTFVDHVRVVAARVPDGARLRVGSTTLDILYDAEPSPVELWPAARFGPLVGGSVAMRAIFARLARVASTDAPVLVQGETGTGKELVARALHEASPRAAEPFVVVDCAALSESLLEAELFGHARGAFTGAHAARAGAIEAAHGGTVFLDEIGELPLAMQPKLLRVLESRTVRRLGETQHRAVDVRFIAATHRDLGQMVNVGAFREDLYFRLAVLPIHVPPLRERAADVPMLVEVFLARHGGGAVAPEVLAELGRRPWLGNVRELRNVVERMRALGAKEALASPVRPAPAAPPARGDEVPFEQPFKEFREQWIEAGEREYLRRLLERHGHAVASAAKEAGVARTYIYRLLRRYGL